MKRKERMLKIREEIKGVIKHQGTVNVDVLIAKCMLVFGLSKRDAKDEVMALIIIEQAEAEMKATEPKESVK